MDSKKSTSSAMDIMLNVSKIILGMIYFYLIFFVDLSSLRDA